MLGEVLQFHAETTARHRMSWVTCHLDQLAVFDVIDEGTCIGAILRAGTTNGFGFG
jgi:hypothetical protein